MLVKIKMAQRLTEARKSLMGIEHLSKSFGDFSVSDAYHIQALGIEDRKIDGEKVIGMKMGLTSEAKRKQMNLHSPVYGTLTDSMMIPNRGIFPLRTCIHPKVEPEIGFLTNRDLGPGASYQEVLDACGSVAACLEIIDSRYENFQYFSLPDVIADNASGAFFVHGNWMSGWQKRVSLKSLEMKLLINGQQVEVGNSSAISGDPVKSVAQLCELLAKDNLSLPAHSIILAGSATNAYKLEPGMKVRLEVDHLDPVNFDTVSGT